MVSALSGRIYDAGIRIDLVVSPSEENGRSLAESCEASWSPVPQFPVTTDIIIVASA